MANPSFNINDWWHVKLEGDGELFAEKMARLTAQFKTQFAESSRLEAEIKKNLAGLGYEL